MNSLNSGCGAYGQTRVIGYGHPLYQQSVVRSRTVHTYERLEFKRCSQMGLTCVAVGLNVVRCVCSLLSLIIFFV